MQSQGNNISTGTSTNSSSLQNQNPQQQHFINFLCHNSTALPKLERKESMASTTTIRTNVHSTPRKRKSHAEDDVDILLRHCDFPRLLALATQIHHAHHRIATTTGQSYTSKQDLPQSHLTVEDVMGMTNQFQQSLLSSSHSADVVIDDANDSPSDSTLGPTKLIQRGEFPISDSIMDECLSILSRERQDMLDVLNAISTNSSATPNIITSTEIKAAASATPEGLTATMPKSSALKPNTTMTHTDRKKKEAIAIKYSKWQTDILMNWMIQHKEEPFPDQTAITMLMEQTGLSHSQIVNWTTNVRKRNRKATCQKGKKPHHFIDFLFLVHDREMQLAAAPGSTKTLPVSSWVAKQVSRAASRQHSRHDSEPDLCPESLNVPSQRIVQTDYSTTSSSSCTSSIPPSLRNTNLIGSWKTDQTRGMEPFSLSWIDNNHDEHDTILREFASIWLTAQGSADEDAEGSIDSLSSSLGPSVTNDDSIGGDDRPVDETYPLNQCLIRATSFNMTEMGDVEDMESWAQQYGLSLEEQTS